MMVVALVALSLGLVLGVFVMLYGTERRVRSSPHALPHEQSHAHDVTTEPSPLFNLASLSAFAVGFGLTGYLLVRNTAWSVPAQVVVAGVAGGLAMALQSLLIARWAIPGARAEIIDERYAMQGVLGTIVREVPAHGSGVLSYVVEGRAVELPARALDDTRLAAGTEVVIDRVEEGVAYVELWTLVESRL